MSTIDPSQFAAAVVNDVRRWLERAVIGLNLCPFAKAVHVRGQVHYAVTRADSAAEILILKTAVTRPPEAREAG